MANAAGPAVSGGSALGEYITRQMRSTSILAAVGAALDSIATGTPLEPALRRRSEEVIRAVGLDDEVRSLSPAKAKQMLAEMRFCVLLDAKMLAQSSRSLAWDHADGEILEAGGEVSAAFAEVLTHAIAPRLDGLAARLGEGGSFLEVGVGAAGLSVAMARLWPRLRVTGIDPWAPSVALAEENVRRAGLGDRIELRQQGVEELDAIDAFDLAWIPSAFLPERVIATACERVHAALRPGGWLLFAMANPGSDPVNAAIVRLRTVFWGGCVLEADAIEQRLRQIGFADVEPLPSPPGSLVAMIAARRTG